MPAPPSDGSPPARVFSDEEAAVVLRRAAELQAAPSAADGLSLADLVDAARQAEIDPALVHRAVAELDAAGPPDPGARLRGGARRLVLERVVDGDLDDAGVEAALAEVRHLSGDPGVVTRHGHTLAWSPTAPSRAQPNARPLRVTLRGSTGQVVVRAEEDLGPVAGGLFGGLMGGVGGGVGGAGIAVGLAVVHSVALATGVAAVALGGSYALARTLYARAARRRAAELEHLVARIAGALRGGDAAQR